jgi:sugar lactone lactonase YvrE
MAGLDVLVKGLGFAEGIRWHDGTLWFSDFLHRTVCSVDSSGTVTELAYVQGQPSGLGFTPGGVPLVASMFDRWILRLEEGAPRTYAYLGEVCRGPLNDMLVDTSGRAYVSCLGWETFYEPLVPESVRPAPILMVNERGEAEVAADGLVFPNGIAVTPDGSTLVVAETFGCRLTAFDIAPDGRLSNQRTFADLGPRQPDGITIDRDGGVWAACPYSNEFIRAVEGGEVTDVIPTGDRMAVTCTLGGDDFRTLYCVTALTDPARLFRGESEAAIEYMPVGIPGFPANR